MNPQDFQEELDKREADRKSEEKDTRKQQSIEQAKSELIDAMVQSTKANMRHRERTTTKVEVQNPGADTTDINRAIEAINNVAVLMLSQSQKGSVNLVDGTDLGERLSSLGDTLSQLLIAVRDDTKQDKAADAVTQKLDSLISQLKTLQVAPDPDAKQSLASIEQAIKGLDLSPKVTVPAPKVTVQGKDVDLTPLVGLLTEIKDVLSKPEVEDHSDIVSGLSQVQNAIESLTFPVPNYVLPFKDVNGRAVQVQLDASGNIPTTGGGGGGGAVTVADGADVAQGATTDAAVTSDVNGTLSAKLRGLVKILADVWDSANHRLKVDGSGVTQPVSGTVTANAGTNLNTSLLALETGGNLAAAKTDLDTLAGVVSSSKAAVKMADGDLATLGAKADAKSTATDTTAVSIMQVLKEISFMEQNPASRAVTNAGTFAVQATLAAETTKIIGAINNLPATVDTNSGNKSASTLRVVLATDQPQLTNKLLVTPDANSAVNVAQIGGNTVATDVGASSNATQRVVQANNAGKTIVGKGGTAASSGDNTLVAAGTNKLKVFSITLSTLSTTAMTCKITDGAGGSVLDEVVLQAPSSISTGYTRTVTPPAHLFATSNATALVLNLSSANTVYYSLSYYDEA